jgi:tRNA(Arg) A34 adenosine deaminase TadA
MNRFMQIAVRQALAAKAAGDFPYGAVLVRRGDVLATGRNRMNAQIDPTGHAEIDVLRDAGLQDSFTDTVMYASAFPCLMCAGPIVYYGVPEIIAGASWDGYDVSRSFMESHGVKITVLELEECRKLLVETS